MENNISGGGCPHYAPKTWECFKVLPLNDPYKKIFTGYILMASWVIRETTFKSGLNPGGFPGGGWAINPYVDCSHGCRYCYARFMKKFTGHTGPWRTFVDVRTNIFEVVAKNLSHQNLLAIRFILARLPIPINQQKHIIS